MRRNRIILVVLFLVLIVLALIPLVDGIYFKRHYFALIENINRLENDIKLQIDYRQGWFTSHATLQIVSEARNETDFPLRFTIEQTIHHGPLVKDEIQNQYTFAIASIKNTLHIPDPIERFLLAGKDTSSGILQIHSIAHFNGDYVSKLTTPVFTFQLTGLGKLSWDGLKGDMYFKIDNDIIQEAKSNITIGMFLAESEETSPITKMMLKIQPITINSNAIREPVGLWTGNSVVSLPSIIVNRSDQLIASFNNLTISYNISINANNYNISEKINLQKLEIPGVFINVISPANFTMSANNFNVQGIVDLLNYARAESNSNIFSDEAKKQRYFALLAKTITSNSSFTGDFSATTSHGSIAVNGKINWPTLPSSLEGMFQYFAKANLKISAPLLEGLIDEYYVPPPSPTTVVTTNQVSPQESFNRKLAELMQQGKLAVPVAMEIIDMRDKQVPTEEFNAKLKSLNLSPDIIAVIAQAYTQEKADEAKAKATPVAQPPVDPKKALLDSWIQQGYLIQTGNDYTAEFTLEGGILKINGKIPPENLFDLSRQPASTPAAPLTPTNPSPNPVPTTKPAPSQQMTVPILHPAPTQGTTI